MPVACASCGQQFDAKRATAKFCSGRCRKRAADMRSRTGDVVPMRRATPRPEAIAAVGSPLADALRNAFKDADLASPAGQIALRLCADVDALAPGAPGYAGIVAQMRAAVDDLRSQAKPKVATPLTMLRERRAADRAAASG